MSEINSFSDYASKYNTNMDYSSLFGGGAPYIDNGMGGINVSDYAMIKNGSYGKLMKAYYAFQCGLAEKVCGSVGRCLAL